MERLRTFIESMGSWFGALSQRERRLVAVGLVAAAGFLVFATALGFSNKATVLQKRITEKNRKLVEMQSLATSYAQARAAQDAFAQRLNANTVKLLSWVEECGGKSGLDIPSMTSKPDQSLEGDKLVESAVELTLTDVKLNRLVDFLNAVESGPGVVKVKQLKFEPKLKEDTVTAWATIATWKLKN